MSILETFWFSDILTSSYLMSIKDVILYLYPWFFLIFRLILRSHYYQNNTLQFAPIFYFSSRMTCMLILRSLLSKQNLGCREAHFLCNCVALKCSFGFLLHKNQNGFPRWNSQSVNLHLYKKQLASLFKSSYS